MCPVIAIVVNMLCCIKIINYDSFLYQAQKNLAKTQSMSCGLWKSAFPQYETVLGTHCFSCIWYKEFLQVNSRIIAGCEKHPNSLSLICLLAGMRKWSLRKEDRTEKHRLKWACHSAVMTKLRTFEELHSLISSQPLIFIHTVSPEAPNWS